MAIIITGQVCIMLMSFCVFRKACNFKYKYIIYMQYMDLFFIFKSVDIIVHMKGHYVHTHIRQIYTYQLKLANQ